MFVVFALLLCVKPALGQTRPIISEVFQSAVTIQITTGVGADAVSSEGAGQMSFDQPAGKAREFYAFGEGAPTEIITRYDLGQIFHFNRPTCEIETVTGSMPLFWDWVANAKQGAGMVVHGKPYATWVSLDSATQEVKTVAATNDGTRPVFYEARTPEGSVSITFLSWQTTVKPKPDLFDPPEQCSE